MPAVDGWCDPRMQNVRKVFTGNFAKGEEVGAAICVYLDDELVVDLWGGVADQRTGRAWLRDTPCPVFSCTKALTAACAARLWEQGAYDVEAPVTTWWPEFGRAGKARASAAHLLSHQAGLPAFDTPVSVADAADPAALADRLAAQTPLWEPGTAHGYHALTFGWLAGEIVRRLAGQTTGEYLRDHIAGPLGLGVWLGAPDDVIERAAKLTARKPETGRDGAPADATSPPGGAAGPPGGAAGPPGGAARPPDPVRRRPATAIATAFSDPASLRYAAMYNPDATSVPGGSNNPQVIRAGWPASGALASAAGLAGFYRHLVAGRILTPGTLTAALVPRAHGLDRVLSIDSAFGLGFMRPALAFRTPRTGRDGAFGHAGFGGSIGLGDIRRGVAMAYVANRIGDDLSGGLRAYRLVWAVYNCLG